MRIYTGSYTRMGGPGVGVCNWEDGKLSLLSAARDLNDMIWVSLSADSKHVYASGSDPETGVGAVASYRVDGDRLVLESIHSTEGNANCHLELSRDGRFLYAANYLSGSVTVMPIVDGVVGEKIQIVAHEGKGPHPTRQEAAHTHQSTFRPGADELFVCDLGIDKVVVYAQDPQTGLLERKQDIDMPAGMGPRHLIFANENLFYITGELDNIVRRVDLIDGKWTITGEISTLPEGFEDKTTSAAIRLAEGALWVSNRGHDSVCKIELDEQGNLLSNSWIMTGGKAPRDFMHIPGAILTANQDGGGLIATNGAVLPMDGVVCICPDWKSI